MTRPEDRTALARWGWLITTVGMAAILVVGSWLNYRVVRAAVDTLNLGQAQLLGNALRMAWGPGEEDVDSARLDEILASHAASGLRYVGIVGPNDSILVEAGTKAGPITVPRRSDGPGPGSGVIAVGDRMRAFQPRPPVRPERSPGERAELPGRQEERAPGAEGPEAEGVRATASRGDSLGRRPFPRDEYWNVIEFDPVAADVLAGGRRSLALSALAALLLVSLAMLSWRASERYEATRRAMEEQQRLAVLGEMSAVLAHEIRNPLASLKGNAQLVAEKLPENSPDRTRVARVVAEANRLEVLTADLLDFARTGPLMWSDVDPVELVGQLIEDVDGGPFDLQADQAPHRWVLDAGRVRQALLNVLMNARQASGDGVVTVLVERREAMLSFEVRDTGSGLPAGSENRIFDPFFTTRTNGTGLGLAVARAAVEKHGGRIEADNLEAGGAVFRVVIPSIKGA